jgi:hypothetical protein
MRQEVDIFGILGLRRMPISQDAPRSPMEAKYPKSRFNSAIPEAILPPCGMLVKKAQSSWFTFKIHPKSNTSFDVQPLKSFATQLIYTFLVAFPMRIIKPDDATLVQFA